MKKPDTLLLLSLLSTASAWAQLARWDVGLGVGISHFLSPQSAAESRFRLPEGGTTFVPSLFATYRGEEGRWYGLEAYVSERVLNFIDQPTQKEVSRQENHVGFRFLFGESLPVSAHLDFETTTGLHAECIFERACYSSDEVLPPHFAELDGEGYARFGAFVETGFRWDRGMFRGHWFFRLDADVIATRRESFDRSRYLAFSTGLRVPVLTIQKEVVRFSLRVRKFGPASGTAPGARGVAHAKHSFTS